MAEKGEKIKGNLLEIGLQGKNYETKKGIKILYFEYVLIIMICFILAILSVYGIVTIFESNILAFLICFLAGILIIILLLFVGGQEIDGIYENGFTYRWVGLIKKIQGKQWIKWNEVEKIFYGDYFLGKELGTSQYIRIISEDKDTTPFIRYLYDRKNPKFYKLLVNMLRERSPQAQWIKENLNFNK